MKPIHNRTAFLLSLTGGILVVASGLTGAIGVLDEMLEALNTLFGPGFVLTFGILTGILGVLTLFTGVAIMIGGFLLTTHYVEDGRIILFVAAGVAALCLGFSLAQALVVGDLRLDWGLQIAQSLGWIGLILVIDARIIADQRRVTEGMTTQVGASST